MKLILIILILTLFFVTTFSQNQDWEIYFGISNQTEVSHRLLETYDMGLFINGSVIEGGYAEGWDIKTDINGNVLWNNKLFYDITQVGACAVITDDAGNRYECSYFYSEILGYWPYIVKFDSCGEKQWCRILKDDDFNYGFAMDVVINENNEIIVLAYYASFTTTDRIFLAGLNENGATIWKKAYATQNDHPWIKDPVGYCLKEFNKEYYIGGWCYWPYPDDTTHFFLRP
ncbi:MAG: hypothetical protein FJY07_10960, partial [Bacteroidetes bacterium]|nr:hypothetical protein [Bacteroidota bacterium]